MSTKRSRVRVTGIWTALPVLTALLGSGCSLAMGDAEPATPATISPYLQYSVSERSFDARGVTLLPQELQSTAGFGEAEGLRLYLGGMGRFRSDVAADPFNRLALVIMAASDSINPILVESRQLLLDIDGEFYKTHPIPDPRLYSFGSTELGYTETVIIPIDQEMLTRLVTARRVRGRIGHWIAFDFSSDVVERLGDLLLALPEDFPSAVKRGAGLPRLRATY